MKISALQVAAILAAGMPFAKARAQDDALIRAAKRTPVSTLSASYPARALEEWLADLGGVSVSRLSWEVNDCGEGGDGREAPTCVEAALPIAQDTTVHIGIFLRSIDGRTVEPGIWMLYKSERGKIDALPTLDAVVEYVRQVRG